LIILLLENPLPLIKCQNRDLYCKKDKINTILLGALAALSTYYLGGAITVVRDPRHRTRVAY
jgi:hypothetical protein